MRYFAPSPQNTFQYISNDCFDQRPSVLLIRIPHVNFFTFQEMALDLCSQKIYLRVLSFRFI